MLGVQPEVSCCQENILLKLWVSDPVQSPVTKCPHLYLNCRRAWLRLCIFRPKSRPLSSRLPQHKTVVVPTSHNMFVTEVLPTMVTQECATPLKWTDSTPQNYWPGRWVKGGAASRTLRQHWANNYRELAEKADEALWVRFLQFYLSVFRSLSWIYPSPYRRVNLPCQQQKHSAWKLL